MRRRSWAAILAAAGVLTGCRDPLGQPVCTASWDPGVVVEMRDARTGAPIADAARGSVRDGAYVDSLRPYGSLGPAPGTLYSRSAAHERVGIYSVEVLRDGYLPWTAEGVRVTRGVCHVRTQTLRADMTPVP